VTRGAALVVSLREAEARVRAVLAAVDERSWSAIPSPGVWSIGKEAEHIAEAALLHQWQVRLTIGEPVGRQRPLIERRQLTTPLTLAEADALIRERTDESTKLIAELRDAQLELPTRPPRARGEVLASTIQRVLIGHYNVHATSIEAKLRQQNTDDSGS
jgi:hypothetical protein